MKQITPKQYAKIYPPPSAGSAGERADFEHHIQQRASVLPRTAANGAPCRSDSATGLRSTPGSAAACSSGCSPRFGSKEAVGEDADCFGLDSTSVKLHPDGTGLYSIGKSRGGWNTKTHMVSASDRQADIFRLSGGHAHDAPEGRVLLESWDAPVANAPLAMERVYEGDKTRRLVRRCGCRRSCRRRLTGKSNGTTTGKPTSLGTRSSGYSGDSRADGASSRCSTNSTRCFWTS